MLEEVFKLLLSLLFGALIGLEREIKKTQTAGLRTYSLVSLGACLFSIVAFSLGKLKIIDPSLIITAIALGMGFIGAGGIFHKEDQVIGLTTAAGLWSTAAIGLAVGAGFYFLAVFATFLVLVILTGFKILEERILKR